MRYAPSNITTFVMIGFTLWLIIGRFKLRRDSSWPLVYYLFVVIYHQSLPGRMNSYAIFVSVLCALFLRFEFLNRGFTGVIRVVEFFCLGAILLGLASHLFL